MRLFQKTCVFELILLSVTVQLRVCLTYFLKSVDFSVRNKSFSPEFSGIKRLYGKLPVAQIRLTLDPGYLCAQSWKLPMMPCFFVNSLVNYFQSHWLDRRECSSDPRVCVFVLQIHLDHISCPEPTTFFSSVFGAPSLEVGVEVLLLPNRNIISGYNESKS